jgi:hypothetical protein
MSTLTTFRHDCQTSTSLILNKRLNYLLLAAPLALLGKSGWLGEASCFLLAGLALIPLAEVSLPLFVGWERVKQWLCWRNNNTILLKIIHQNSWAYELMSNSVHELYKC